MIIKKTVEFDSAHMLTNHEGGCKNLHGHTYKMIVGVYGDTNSMIKTGSSTGMVMDFKELKKILKEFVDQLDHAYIYNVNESFQSSLAEMLIKNGKKVFKMETETTVENMCQRFIADLKKLIPIIHSVEIWETPTSSCYIEVKEIKE